MKLKLAYGKQGLWVDLPEENVSVVAPKFIPGLADEMAAQRASLRAPRGTPPLRELVKSGDSVAVVFSDLTRPQPREKMLKVLLEELAHVPAEQIVLINGIATHRFSTEAELLEMLGKDVNENYRVIQHDAWDYDKMVRVGKTPRGHDVFVNAEYQNAGVRILTGFIEPHLFAGFSGGPKGVLPAIVDHQTIQRNHGAAMIASPQATWGVLEGNPIQEEMRAVALLTSPTFLFNVTLNREKQVTGVFSGDMLEAHALGCSFARQVAMAPVSEPFDIVITTNSGYPLDLNLYQSIKGISAAAQVVKPGGSIVIASECWEGIPEHGEYGSLLQMADSPQGLLKLIHSDGFEIRDQWQVQIQAQIQMHADVFVYSDYLDEQTLKRVKLQHSPSVEETLGLLLKRYGKDASVCVLPEGPMTIPYIKK